MSDYFAAVKAELASAVDRRAHVPWYLRVRLPASHRGLVVVFATLMIATPAVAAVGAVSGWFSPGKPEAYQPSAPTSGLGEVLPKGDRMLPLRVADPDGGPPWGVRLVTTTRGDTCIQVGRVENGEIGSLGIDGAWANDHRFHEIKPNDDAADICGATDGAGYGFVDDATQGAPTSGYALANRPGRFIFAGLLGPDAKTVTYQTPSGRTKTERTSGGVGAYLIVFKETKANCNYYVRTLVGGSTRCEGDGTGVGYTLGPVLRSSVSSVTYKDGATCDAQRSQCEPVGWVPGKHQPIKPADITSPLKVSVSEIRPARTKGSLLPLVRVSFTAREPVTSSNSSYQVQVQYPSGGQEDTSTDRDIRRGDTVTLPMTVFPSPPGVYHGTISFTPNDGVANPYQSGQLLVGRFSFKLPPKK
jgi:hypothetical protein